MATAAALGSWRGYRALRRIVVLVWSGCRVLVVVCRRKVVVAVVARCCLLPPTIGPAVKSSMSRKKNDNFWLRRPAGASTAPQALGLRPCDWLVALRQSVIAGFRKLYKWTGEG